MRQARVEIKKLGINGEGIGYIHKKICFIPQALPGEIVNIEITKQTPQYYMGKVINYVKESPYRISSFCKEYQLCQGCALTSLDYRKQLQFKKDLLKDAIKKYTDFEIDRLPIQKVLIGSSQKEYKHVVSLPVTEFKRKVRFGIYQRGSQYLTLMSQCKLQDPLINRVLDKMENLFQQYHMKSYNDHLKTGLRFVEVKNIDGNLQILFVTGNDGINEKFTKEISRIKEVKSLFLTINTTRHQDFKLQGYKRIYGESQLPFSCFDHTYFFSMKSEFPIYPEIEKLKLEKIKSLIPSQANIISLYCQTGMLELSLHQSIVAIDDKDYHIQDAKNNAKEISSHVSFLYGNVDDLVVSQCKKKSFDCMIIRKESLSPEVKQSILLSKITDIIYVSDHPSSIAKDLHELKDNYRIETIIPIDSYPQTAKLEVIVKLHKK